MLSSAGHISSYFIHSLWLTPLLWALGWLACRVAQRLGSSTAHRIWVTVLLAAVLLPALPMALPWLGSVMWQASVASGSATLHWSTLAASAPSRQHGYLLWSSSLLRGLSLLYALALLLFCFRLLRSVLCTLALVRRASPCQLEPALEQIRQEVTLAYGVSADIFETAEVTGPATVAIGGSALLLPEGFVQSVTADDFRVALAHECAHIHRHDCRWNLFYELVGLPIAFHPVSWIIKAKIEQTRELICDEIAVRQIVESRVYVNSHLRLAMFVASSPRVTSAHAIGIFDANILEKRIMELRAVKKETNAALRYSLLGVSVLCLFLAFIAAATAPQILSAQEEQTGKVYKVGGDVSAPVLISAVEAQFPLAVHRKDTDKPFTGTSVVSVSLVVDATGLPRDVHVLRSGGKDFDEAAVKAVEQYRFKPAMREGNPVPVELNVEVNFQTYGKK